MNLAFNAAVRTSLHSMQPSVIQSSQYAAPITPAFGYQASPPTGSMNFKNSATFILRNEVMTLLVLENLASMVLC